MHKPIIHDEIILKKRSIPATKQDLSIAIDLKDTLVANIDKAAGLACNMIGINKQIIALNISGLPVVMINPTITKKSKQYQATEGCLSLTGERQTLRYQEITVSYQDLSFKKHQQNFSDWIAEVIQHEIDHCQGILI